MNKTDLLEYADYLLKIAVKKVENIEDARDLVSETLLSALVSITQGKPIENPKGWLVTVLDRKYYDMLRRKYRKGTVSIDAAYDIPDSDEFSREIEKSQDAENIRRCLAHLTAIYREVMVRYYIHSQSVKEIAKALNIPENTVKTRLGTGRQHIRKDFSMENFTKQSYEPETLWISISGRQSIKGEPFSLVGNSKIEMNLLILAYEKPVTIPELAGAIGISTAYIEPIVDKLVKGELLKRTGDKVYTDFIIFDENDRTANIELEKELADAHYKEVWEIMQKGLDELHDMPFYKKQTPSAAVKLDSFFAVRTVHQGINKLTAEKAGMWDFEKFADRPNDGKWHAIGSRYPAHYDWSEGYAIYYNRYDIDGELDTYFSDYEDLKTLTFSSYDTHLGKTHHGWNDNRYVKYPIDERDLTKMLWAIYSGKEDLLPVINNHCFDNIEGLIKLSILKKDESGRVIIDVPVIKLNDRWALYKLSDSYAEEISDKLKDKFKKLLDNPVKLPSHLKSVPEWQRYMHCSSLIKMMIIENAHKNGLFLAGRDLIKNPAPAVFLAIEEK